MKAARFWRISIGFGTIMLSLLLTVACGSDNEPAGATPSPAATAPPAAKATPAATATRAPGPSGFAIRPVPRDKTAGLQELPQGLYVGEVDTGEIRQVDIPNPGQYAIGFMSWTSPGQMLVAIPPDFLYVVDIDQATLRQLSSGAPFDMWFTHSPSGKFVARPETWAGGSIIVWSLEEEREVLRTPATGSVGVGSLMWAPDEKHLSYRTMSQGGSGEGATVFIARLEQPITTVTADLGGDLVPMEWSPDSRSIVFSNTAGIFSLDAESGEETLLYSWPQPLDSVPSELSLSFDGRYAVVAARIQGRGNIASRIAVSLEDGRAIEITATEDVKWSPTEDVLLVVADWCKPSQKLLLVEPDGTTRATLTQGETVFGPHWSPDGTMIAFSGGAPAAEPGMADQGARIIRTDGSEVTFIPLFFETEDWSPDSKRIAYSVDLPRHQCAQVEEQTEIRPFP